MQRHFPFVIIVVIATLTLTPRTNSQSPTQLDLLITGGKVLDGTGNPWFYANIGIKEGKIIVVGRMKEVKAKRTIDATGLVITPGFIDIHSHADDGDESGGLRDKDSKRRAAPNLVSQGVTTVVVNQDGRSPWPIREQIEALRKKIGPNAILMFGHGTIRRMVMQNDFQRPATDEEIKQMQELARQAMQEGALGMSAGLEYTPGRWSTTDEVAVIVEAIVPHGGIYISHQRSEGADPMWYWPTQHAPGAPTLIDAVMETIEIGERTGATVIASHVKAKGAHYWGTSHAVIQLIQSARRRGVSVWADQYPYNTSGTDGNTVLIPAWTLGRANEFSEDKDDKLQINFAALLRQRLAVATDAEKIRADIAHEIRRRGGAENIMVFDYPDSSWIEKSLSELTRAHGISPVEMALKLQLEGFPNRRGGARLRGFSMSEEDVEAYAAQPWTMTSSDAGIALPSDEPVHARFYGTFPRKIRHYAINRGALSVESAVRSMTSLPAQVLGIRDRGMIREGFWADMAILNLEQLQEKSTFLHPHQYAEGIEYVLVNGQFVVDAGKLTWALPGAVITRPAIH